MSKAIDYISNCQSGSGGLDGIDVGVIIEIPFEEIPESYLECDGSSLLKTEFTELYDVIGTDYGSVDNDHFNIPDYRGIFLRGWDHGRGMDPDSASRLDRGDGTTGDYVGTRQNDEFKSHNHSIDAGIDGSGTITAIDIETDVNSLTPSQTNDTGGNETRPKNVNIIYCIKYTDEGVEPPVPVYLLSDGSIPLDTNYVPTDDQDIATSSYVVSNTGGGGVITGEIIMWPGNTPPTGYLLCNGATYNYNDYPELGALFGSSAGGTFDTPDIDLFAKNSRGTNTLTKESAGVGTHGHTSPSHNHTVTVGSTGSTHSHLIDVGTADAGTGQGAGRINDGTNTGNGGTEASTHSHSTYSSYANTTINSNQDTGPNQPVCTLINFCIKY